MIYSSFQRSNCKYAKRWAARFPIFDCTFFVWTAHFGWTGRLNYTMSFTACMSYKPINNNIVMV